MKCQHLARLEFTTMGKFEERTSESLPDMEVGHVVDGSIERRRLFQEMREKEREQAMEREKEYEREKRINRKRFTKKEREEVYIKYNGHCAYCGCELDIKNMQIDHVTSVIYTFSRPQTV